MFRQECWYYFGISLTIELVSFGDKLLFEFMLVLDDTIMSHEKSCILIDMWMSIAFCDTTMGRSTSVSDSEAESNPHPVPL